MNLEAATVSSGKLGQASQGRNQNDDTANRGFSDALKDDSETNHRTGTRNSTNAQNLPDNSGSAENEMKNNTLSDTTQGDVVMDEKESVVSIESGLLVDEQGEDANSEVELIEPVAETPGKTPEAASGYHHTVLPAQQILMEKLTASNMNNSGELQSKITTDGTNQKISNNFNGSQTSTVEMEIKTAAKSDFQGNNTVDRKILENLLNQREFQNRTSGNKPLAMNANSKEIANSALLSTTETTNSIAALSSVLNKNNSQTTAVRDGVSLQYLKENSVGEKLGQELKYSEVKLGEMKLERVAPSNFNQLIINTLSAAGKISPISTNVITPGQISTPMHKTLTIQLHPENLGVVEVRIVDNNGRLNIAIETNTPAAEKILKAEISVLTEKLAVSGILHDEMTVRNNPGLELLKENNNHERNGALNPEQMDGRQTGENGANRFDQQLRDENNAEGNDTRDLDRQLSTPVGEGENRDGIYL